MGLHKSVVWLTGVEGATWTAEEVAGLAGVQPGPALAYLRRLGAMGVLAESGGLWAAGRGAAKWRLKEPKTKPGGNNATYKAHRQARDAVLQRVWRRAREEREKQNPAVWALLTPPQPDLSRQGPIKRVSYEPIKDMDEHKASLISRAQAAAILGVHPLTIKNMAKKGRLKEYVLGPNLTRVSLKSVQDLLQERNGT